MRGISGTCLMVTFLPGTAGALDESQAFTAGPAHPLSPRVTGHNKRTLKQEAIKSLICLHVRKHSVGFRQRGEGGQQRLSLVIVAGWSYLFVSRKHSGPESAV